MNKKNFVLILVLVLCFSFYFLKKYNSDIVKKDVYILQVGAYNNYENVSNITKNYENYIIDFSDDLYKIYIGVTKDKDIFDKIKEIYVSDSEVYMKVLNINNEKFLDSISKYDNVLKYENNKSNIDLIIKEELKELEKILN